MSTRRMSMRLMPLEMLASCSSISFALIRDGGAVERAVVVVVVVVVGGGLRLRIVSSAILDFACLGLLACLEGWGVRGEGGGEGESV